MICCAILCHEQDACSYPGSILLLLYYSRLRVERYRSLRALNTSPPQNCFSLLRSSCIPAYGLLPPEPLKGRFGPLRVGFRVHRDHHEGPVASFDVHVASNTRQIKNLRPNPERSSITNGFFVHPVEDSELSFQDTDIVCKSPQRCCLPRRIC